MGAHNKNAPQHLEVNYEYFRNIFNTEYNISFKSPATDVCSYCILHKEKVKKTEGAEKQTQMTKLRVHKLRAKQFYIALRKAEEGVMKLSFDCQKKLPMPKLPDQANYYSRQSYVYNFTVCEGCSKTSQNQQNTFIYTWSECDFKRGSNEIASALHHRLTNTNWECITSLELYADGAAGQNKNSVLIGMLSKNITDNVLPSSVKHITVYFPVTGHSFLPPDRIFGRLEKKFRKMECIVHPSTYIEEFKKVGTVFQLGKDVICYDWKQAVEGVLKKPGFWHFSFKQTKRFIITRSNKGNALIRGELFYRSNTGKPLPVYKRGCSMCLMNPHLVPVGVRLPRPKLTDIGKLLVNHYGENWHQVEELDFFKTLMEQNNLSEMDYTTQEGDEDDVDEPMQDINLRI